MNDTLLFIIAVVMCLALGFLTSFPVAKIVIRKGTIECREHEGKSYYYAKIYDDPKDEVVWSRTERECGE